MGAVTSGSLHVECAVSIRDTLDFNMSVIKNSHTVVRIRGVVSDEIGLSEVSQKLEGSVLTVSQRDEGGGKSPIFCGFIQTIEVWQELDCSMVCVEAASSTVLLDREKKSRSFQKTDMTYKELVRKVLGDTPGAQVIFQIDDRELGSPIYQYEETDWEFLKRIASHLGTALLPFVLSPSPHLYFGLPRGKKREGWTGRVERLWLDRTYDKFCRKPYHPVKKQFLCRDIASYEKWEPGDTLLLPDGTERRVLSLWVRLKNGLVSYTYTLGYPQAFGVPRYENPCLAGVSLPGTILETRQESVRVCLDMDSGQPDQEGFWYPWMPETGNPMYCMPEVGQRIEITIDGDCRTAWGSRCLRENGNGNSEMQDMSKRYFTSNQDKRMYFLPQSLGFVDLKQEIPLKIELEDETGVDIESSRGIHLMAREGIWFNARSIFFQAPQEISIIRRDMTDPTVINMCNGFDSVGKFSTVRMKGSGGADFPLLESDSDEYDLSGAEEAIHASTPAMAGATKLEQRVTGTRIDKITAG